MTETETDEQIADEVEAEAAALSDDDIRKSWYRLCLRTWEFGAGTLETLTALTVAEAEPLDKTVEDILWTMRAAAAHMRRTLEYEDA